MGTEAATAASPGCRAGKGEDFTAQTSEEAPKAKAFKSLFRERESTSGTGGGTEGKEDSPLSAEPDAGLDPSTLRS